jgi:hypothetical protein
VASIRPLLQRLSFTREKESWGLAFRRSVFRIDLDDYRQIAQAMGVADEKAVLGVVIPVCARSRPSAASTEFQNWT